MSIQLPIVGIQAITRMVVKYSQPDFAIDDIDIDDQLNYPFFRPFSRRCIARMKAVLGLFKPKNFVNYCNVIALGYGLRTTLREYGLEGTPVILLLDFWKKSFMGT